MYYLKYYWFLYVYCTFASIFSLYFFIHRQYEYAKSWTFKNLDNPLDKEDYDFIVVGGGTAGSLVAGRLAENPNFNILLIEGGGGSSAVHDIPVLGPMIQQSPYDWQFRTVPQSHACFGLQDQVSKWPMGKILGGSSRLNYMIYLRGHESDFSNWVNGEDWTIPDILYYFRKSENHLGKFKDDSNNHGRVGPIYVSDMTYTTAFGNAVVQGLSTLGIPTVDLNTLSIKSGAMISQLTSFLGSRWSTEYALYSLNVKLSIVTDTVVNKVLLRQGFEASGVEYTDVTGRKGTIRARHGVILSAGTVGSAKILMLSGIGPSYHLNNISIHTIVDLPVGDNLQDHVTTGLDLILLNETLISVNPIEPLRYIFTKKGLMTHPGCEVVSLLNTDGSDRPDIELMALPAGISTDQGSVLRHAMAISDKLWDKYFSNLREIQVGTILPTLLHPKSKGYVRLASSDVRRPPIINPNYLTHPEDVATIIRGLRVIEKLVNTKEMSGLGAKLNRQVLPGCEDFVFGSDQYWECYVRHLTITAYHPVGTCTMGGDPSSSVVDHQLSVHGTSRLYVIDGSVMPNLPSGNTQATVMMIAEKGADILKYKWATRFNTCTNTFLKPPPYTQISYKQR